MQAGVRALRLACGSLGRRKAGEAVACPQQVGTCQGEGGAVVENRKGLLFPFLLSDTPHICFL